METIAVCWRRAPVAIVWASLVLLDACSARPVEDPDRAGCKQQVESFYSLTQAPNFFEKGYTNSAFDAVLVLAAQVKDSKDSYCKLVGEKAIEIKKRRAMGIKSAAEVEANVAQLLTPTGTQPEGSGGEAVAPAPAPEPARDAAASSEPIASPPAVVRTIPDAARPDYAPAPRRTYCQWNAFTNGILEMKWACFSRPPEGGAKVSCEERLRVAGMENPNCYCTTDPDVAGGKCP